MGHLAARTTGQGDLRQFLKQILEPLHPGASGLAERLLDRYGSLFAIAQAPDADILGLAAGERHLAQGFLAVRQLLLASVREEVVRTRLVSESSVFRDYVWLTLRGLKSERLVAFFCDGDRFLLSEEVVAEGSSVSLAVSMRNLLSRALALDSKIAVLAHNHPSGSPEPSAADIEATRCFRIIANEVGIELADHLTVGRQGVVSMKDRGLV